METPASPSLHALLLLSDSALPLGSFAFSSGLESYLAHHKYSNGTSSKNSRKAAESFETFLYNSISNVGTTALPYVLAAHQNPTELFRLDNDFDASTPCTVARRASVSQGRALLAIWSRSLSYSVADNATSRAAASALDSFSAAVKKAQVDAFGFTLNAHFAPLFGVICCALGLAASETAYLFSLNHAKAVLSAAVRANVVGPYQSQAILASESLRECIQVSIARESGRKVEDTAVTVPTMDLWLGRHELLYSRIFNS